MKRQILIREICEEILDIESDLPVKVGIDGVDASGKTTLAEQLTEYIRSNGREVIRASVDGFHHPQEIRYRRGESSPEGYFYDSFDYKALKTELLQPLSSPDDRHYRTTTFDFRENSETESAINVASIDSILIFEGVFLLRPEIAHYWDLSIFVDADFDVTIERAAQRDQYLFGAADEVRQRYYQKYIPGQKIYLKKCNPKEKADIIVKNNDPEFPELERK